MPKMAPCRILITAPARFSNGTPVKDTLRFWPPFPIVMRYGGFLGSKPTSLEEEENLLTTLRQPDRISEIWLTTTGSLSDRLRLGAELQIAMPSLEALRLMVQDKSELLLPDDFLGGPAPRLSVISLYGVAFPALPKLLPSTRNLLSLELWDIPRSGYFSPDALVSGLSGMMQFKSLTIHFTSPIRHLHANNSLPSGRVSLPKLTNLKFCGDSEYLEAIVARIDTPVLELIDLSFFNRLVFEIPHLSFFTRRTSQLAPPTQAKIYASGSSVSIILIHQPPAGTTNTTIPRQLRLQVSCRQFDWQLSAISQISSQLSPLFSRVGQLDIRAFPPPASGRDDLDLAQWVELLRLFDRVERLRVVDELVLDVARALQRVTSEQEQELFPALRELSLSNSLNLTAALEAIAPFVSIRELSGYPIIVYNWDTSSFINEERR